jgi:hypothetical protein
MTLTCPSCKKSFSSEDLKNQIKMSENDLIDTENELIRAERLEGLLYYSGFICPFCQEKLKIRPDRMMSFLVLIFVLPFLTLFFSGLFINEEFLTKNIEYFSLLSILPFLGLIIIIILKVIFKLFPKKTDYPLTKVNKNKSHELSLSTTIFTLIIFIICLLFIWAHFV